MKKLAALLALVAFSAQAQYKCTINGKTVYADAPCAHNAKPVGELQDSLSQQQQIDRLKLSIKERRERNAIDGQKDANYQALERATASQNAAETAQARANESARKQRCATLESSMRYNQRSVALAQDVGWQRTLTQHENELKQRRDAYDRECR